MYYQLFKDTMNDADFKISRKFIVDETVGRDAELTIEYNGGRVLYASVWRPDGSLEEIEFYKDDPSGVLNMALGDLVSIIYLHVR